LSACGSLYGNPWYFGNALVLWKCSGILGNALKGPVITGIYRRGGEAIYEEGGIRGFHLILEIFTTEPAENDRKNIKYLAVKLFSYF
jgi:hypothetical protein